MTVTGDIDMKVSRALGSPIVLEIHDVHIAHLITIADPAEEVGNLAVVVHGPRHSTGSTLGPTPTGHKLVLGHDSPRVSQLLFISAVVFEDHAQEYGE